MNFHNSCQLLKSHGYKMRKLGGGFYGLFVGTEDMVNALTGEIVIKGDYAKFKLTCDEVKRAAAALERHFD